MFDSEWLPIMQVDAVLDGPSRDNHKEEIGLNKLNQENGMIMGISESLISPGTFKVLEPRVVIYCENEQNINEHCDNTAILKPCANKVASTLGPEDTKSSIFPDSLMFEVNLDL